MANLLFIYSFISSLLATLTVTSATATDIYCLKSIKDSVIDPNGYLNITWDFNNNTEGFVCRFLGVECWHPDKNRVLNIRLSDLGLKGQFPLGLENCKSLNGLDFSNNKLQGPIPSGICMRLPFITSLDLSYNNFSGEIPSDIANCYFLNSLKLDHNQLTGNIPPQIGQLDRIKVFSVADNRLSGPVPNFGAVIPYDSFVNNAGLCGKPLKNCSSHQQKFEHTFKGGFVIGYIVFSVSVAICFTSYCVPWVYAGERKKKITILGMMMLMRRRKHKITEDDQAGSSLLEEGTKEVSMLEKRVTRMSYADLNDATDNFENFQPKLSNFGEAMLMRSTCTSSVNSELWEMAFVKEDVHGFGVVLLELITRVDPGNMTDSSNNILDVWTDHLLSGSSSYGAIDKSTIGRGFDAEIFQLLESCMSMCGSCSRSKTDNDSGVRRHKSNKGEM
ncbi:hypothetical protein OIU78_025538 [Salix suchowensis]|nr:hypothetical protein OIU78_025538 [Salix suchowensis]